MKMQSAVEEYLVEIEVRKYTPKTIRSYRCNLNLFLRFCAEKLHVETVEALTPAVVRQFSRCMSEAGRKGTYINGVLKSIKSFIQYCYEEGYDVFYRRENVLPALRQRCAHGQKCLTELVFFAMLGIPIMRKRGYHETEPVSDAGHGIQS